MINVKYEEGDTVYYHSGGVPNRLVKGTVEKIVQLDGWGMEHYIISSPSAIEPTLTIRDSLALSSDAKGPINLFKRAKT